MVVLSNLTSLSQSLHGHTKCISKVAHYTCHGIMYTWH